MTATETRNGTLPFGRSRVSLAAPCTGCGHETPLPDRDGLCISCCQHLADDVWERRTRGETFDYLY